MRTAIAMLAVLAATACGRNPAAPTALTVGRSGPATDVKPSGPPPAFVQVSGAVAELPAGTQWRAGRTDGDSGDGNDCLQPAGQGFEQNRPVGLLPHGRNGDAQCAVG